MAKDKKSKGSQRPMETESFAASDARPSSSGLSSHLELQRTHVICGADMNFNTSSTISASQYQAVGVVSSFNMANFKKDLKIDIRRYEGDEMEFEIKGISCAMANTLRRIMIAEVPTMAIENVFMVNNTSIIQDEVLAHRLGLIPLKVDPRLFQFRAEKDAANVRNTIVLKLDVQCRRLADGTIENEKVYSSQLQWLPEGSEMPEETKVTFEGSQTSVVSDVRLVHDDILIAKLRPGQAIELECHCVKGVGEEHAKWSPVATTWYRLFPEVALLKQPPAELAARLEAELPGLVVRRHEDGEVEIGDALQHDKLLEKVRDMSGQKTWAPYVQLRKQKDRFVFTIESTGAWRPHELFKEAVNRISSKCDKVLDGLSTFPERSFDY